MYNKLLGGLLGKLRAMNPVCARLQSISILYWKPKAKQGPLRATKLKWGPLRATKLKWGPENKGIEARQISQQLRWRTQFKRIYVCIHRETEKLDVMRRNRGKWKRQQSPRIELRTPNLCSQCSATEVRQPNSQLPLRVHIHVCIHVHTHTHEADMLIFSTHQVQKKIYSSP